MFPCFEHAVLFIGVMWGRRQQSQQSCNPVTCRTASHASGPAVGGRYGSRKPGGPLSGLLSIRQPPWPRERRLWSYHTLTRRRSLASNRAGAWWKGTGARPSPERVPHDHPLSSAKGARPVCRPRSDGWNSRVNNLVIVNGTSVGRPDRSREKHVVLCHSSPFHGSQHFRPRVSGRTGTLHACPKDVQESVPPVRKHPLALPSALFQVSMVHLLDVFVPM